MIPEFSLLVLIKRKKIYHQNRALEFLVFMIPVRKQTVTNFGAWIPIKKIYTDENIYTINPTP